LKPPPPADAPIAQPHRVAEIKPADVIAATHWGRAAFLIDMA